jgi:membrane-bound metal-dependent hydrolase YbcI (DUF457 family)
MTDGIWMGICRGHVWAKPASVYNSINIFMAGLAHIGFGFASKQSVSKVPIVILVLAAELLDLLTIITSYFNLEKPGQAVWTHSLVMAIFWSLLAALIIKLIYRDTRSSVVVGLVVFSHWILDFITWPMTAIYPNLTSGAPIFLNNSPLVGLGLYKSMTAAIITEITLPLLGIVLYIRYRIKRKRTNLVNEG